MILISYAFSLIHSCLLFIIVASEGIHGPLQKHQINKNKLTDNITVKEVPSDTADDILHTLNILRDENHGDAIDKTDTIEEDSEVILTSSYQCQ